ncbi:hypothetical protein BC830DRAFT_936031 [Chytriomyces sp. MP71]|nr:hypothetical protein BC830DRAFT_936031 [Chytriomyces sp. MP71]
MKTATRSRSTRTRLVGLAHNGWSTSSVHPNSFKHFILQELQNLVSFARRMGLTSIKMRIVQVNSSNEQTVTSPEIEAERLRQQRLETEIMELVEQNRINYEQARTSDPSGSSTPAPQLPFRPADPQFQQQQQQQQSSSQPFDVRTFLDQLKEKISSARLAGLETEVMDRIAAVVQQVTTSINRPSTSPLSSEKIDYPALFQQLQVAGKHLGNTGQHLGKAMSHAVVAGKSYAERETNPNARDSLHRAATEAGNAAKAAFEEGKLVFQATKELMKGATTRRAPANASAPVAMEPPPALPTRSDPNETLPRYNPGNRFREQMNQLHEMGFRDEQENLELLNVHDGNVEAAVNSLMTGLSS